MENKTVSIIVPVYNVEKYIDECVRSLVDQSYDDLEIILVDDGAKDTSPQICDRWSAQDPRVRVIHKANGGAASARNAGIDAATGAYLCFVDSDDTVHPDYVHRLVLSLEENHAHGAVCGFAFHSRSGCHPVAVETTPGLYTGQAYMARFLQDWSCSLLWNKLFRREILGSVRMEEGHRVDDEYFTYQVFLNCAVVAVTDDCLYHYRMRSSSAMQDMTAVQETVMGDRIGYVTARYEKIAEKMPQLEEAFFLDAVNTLTRYWHHSKDMPAAQREIRAWAKAHTGRLLRSRIPLRQKLGYLNRLYWKKPAVVAEPNPIQMEQQEYFD